MGRISPRRRKVHRGAGETKGRGSNAAVILAKMSVVVLAKISAVIPAKAGIHVSTNRTRLPAFVGMTDSKRGNDS